MANIGEAMGFSGGPESTPIATVVYETTHPSVRRGNRSAKVLIIEQDGQIIEISLMTLEDIVNWAK